MARAELQNRPDLWTFDFSEKDIDELETASSQVLNSDVAIRDITPANFPIPGLKSKLENIRDGLINGEGFSCA